MNYFLLSFLLLFHFSASAIIVGTSYVKLKKGTQIFFFGDDHACNDLETSQVNQNQLGYIFRFIRDLAKRYPHRSVQILNENSKRYNIFPPSTGQNKPVQYIFQQRMDELIDPYGLNINYFEAYGKSYRNIVDEYQPMFNCIISDSGAFNLYLNHASKEQKNILLKDCDPRRQIHTLSYLNRHHPLYTQFEHLIRENGIDVTPIWDFHPGFIERLDAYEQLLPSDIASNPYTQTIINEIKQVQPLLKNAFKKHMPFFAPYVDNTFFLKDPDLKSQFFQDLSTFFDIFKDPNYILTGPETLYFHQSLDLELLFQIFAAKENDILVVLSGNAHRLNVLKSLLIFDEIETQTDSNQNQTTSYLLMRHAYNSFSMQIPDYNMPEFNYTFEQALDEVVRNYDEKNIEALKKVYHPIGHTAFSIAADQILSNHPTITTLKALNIMVYIIQEDGMIPSVYTTYALDKVLHFLKDYFQGQYLEQQQILQLYYEGKPIPKGPRAIRRTHPEANKENIPPLPLKKRLIDKSLN